MIHFSFQKRAWMTCGLAGLLAVAPSVGSTQEIRVNIATEQLEILLTELRGSVERLATGNDGLRAKNAQLKEDILQSVQEGTSLKARMQDLEKESEQLDLIRNRKSAEADALKQTLASTDALYQTLSDEIQAVQMKLTAVQEEDDQLSERIRELQNNGSSSKEQAVPPAAALSMDNDLERLKLLKEAFEIKQRIGALDLEHRRLSLQRLSTGDSEVVLESLRRQLILERDDLKAKVDGMSQDTSPQTSHEDLAHAYSPAEIDRLTADIKRLEAQERDLLRQTKKARRQDQPKADAVAEVADFRKLQGNLKRLERENAQLETQISQLSRQMLEMDKQKTDLQRLIQEKRTVY